MKPRREWEGGGEAAQGSRGNPSRLRRCSGCLMALFVKCFFSLRSHSQGLAKPLLTTYKLVWKVFKTHKLTWTNGLPGQIKITKKPLEVGGKSFGAFAHHRALRPHSHFKKPRCLDTTEVKIKHPSLLTQHQGLPKGKVLLATSADHSCLMAEAQGSSLSCEWAVPAFHVGWRAGGWYLQRKTSQAQQLPCH